MKTFRSLIGAAALFAMSAAANAGVVCNSCDYLSAPSIATYLGEHNPILQDNSTFSNATTGFNGDFTNWWIFKVDPAGLASINAIFLPIQNISNFDVDLFAVDLATCAVNTLTTGGECSAFGLGSQIASGDTVPAYATVIDFNFVDAGFYAFRIMGTIAGLAPDQPASYTGNLQVEPLAVSEPGSLALAGLGLMGVGFLRRRKA